MSRTVVIGAGSCIIEAIIKHLGTIPGMEAKADLHLSQITGAGRPPVAAELLATCDILIEEAAPWQGSGSLTDGERGALKPGCVTVSVPTLHFNSLWPLMTEDPRNVPEPGAPYGRIPFGMGDRLALKLVQTVEDPAARRAAYDALDVGRSLNLTRSHELEIRNCFAREQGCDVRVAAYVMSHFREKRLYYTHNHPTGELMYFVLAQLFAVPVLRDLIKLPYDQLIRGARNWADTSNVFGGEEAPVHPAVAEHFGLRWWKRDHRYFWLGEGQTFDEWMDWYLRYQPGQAEEATAEIAGPAEAEVPAQAPEAEAGPEQRLPAGPWLDRFWRSGELLDAVVLAPRIEVNRVAFLVEGEVDAGRAQFGRLFSDPEYRRYTAVESLLGRLPGAEVVGTEGLVVQNGMILRDTMRSLTAGRDAPAVRALEDEAVVLAPGLRRRDLAGRAMCGFTGSWRNYAHWLIEALPRLVAFLLVRQHVPGTKLLLPRLEAHSFQAETLSLLGIRPDEVEAVAADEIVVCEQLYVTSAFDLWSVPPYCRAAADLLVARTGRFLPLPSRPTDRVYIHRREAPARLANFDVLVGVLVQRGFRIIDCASLSLAEQIAAMRGAQMVVGEHGTGFSNLMFCHRGTQVLELFNPANVQPAYWSMASVCGLKYGFMVGSHVPSASSPQPSWNSDYEIAPAALMAAIDSLDGVAAVRAAG